MDIHNIISNIKATGLVRNFVTDSIDNFNIRTVGAHFIGPKYAVRETVDMSPFLTDTINTLHQLLTYCQDKNCRLTIHFNITYSQFETVYCHYTRFISGLAPPLDIPHSIKVAFDVGAEFRYYIIDTKFTDILSLIVKQTYWIQYCNIINQIVDDTSPKVYNVMWKYFKNIRCVNKYFKSVCDPILARLSSVFSTHSSFNQAMTHPFKSPVPPSLIKLGLIQEVSEYVPEDIEINIAIEAEQIFSQTSGSSSYSQFGELRCKDLIVRGRLYIDGYDMTPIKKKPVIR